MSKILFFYVLRSFAVPAVICTFGLCALMLLFMSFDLIGALFSADSAVTWTMASDYLLGTLSSYLEWLLPAVFLLATLYTMWQFCRHSELVAMRAGGVGLGVIVAPIVLVALLAAGLSFLNTELYKPTAALRAIQIKDSDFKRTGQEPLDIAFHAPDDSHTWTAGKMDPANNEVIKDVQITLLRPDGSRQAIYAAPSAQWLDGCWWLTGGVSCTYYDILAETFERHETKPNVPLLKVRETPQQLLASARASQKAGADLGSFADRKADRKIAEQRGMTTREKNEDSYLTYNHFAAPFAIVVVTLFAIPAGIASGRQSVFRGVLLAIGLFLGYYVLVFVTMYLSKANIIKPALAVALPSLIAAAVAIHLFRKLP